MKRIAGAALALALMCGTAYADQFAGMYSNTLTVTHADGVKSTVFINADHTWEQHQQGATVRGTYVWKDATHYCMTITDPKPPSDVDPTECEEMTGDHKPGDTWTITDGTGLRATLSITAGRQ